MKISGFRLSRSHSPIDLAIYCAVSELELSVPDDPALLANKATRLFFFNIAHFRHPLPYLFAFTPS